LENEVRRIGDVRLIIIDPVSSYMGKTDSHKNAEVRGVLEPVGEFAERMRVAVLSVTHFSKAGVGTTTKALHRFIGSIAFIGAPRIAQVVIEDAESDRRLLLHAKNNLAPPPEGLAYRITEKIVGEPGLSILAPYVVWETEHVNVTANEAMAADNGHKDNSASVEAEDFLRDLLADGVMAQKKVKAEAEGAGLSWRTVRRAKNRLGIKPYKERGKEHGSWMWSLTQGGHNASQHARGKMLDTLATLVEAQESQGGQSGQDLDVGTLPDSNGHLADWPELPAFLDRRKQRPNSFNPRKN
jgi:hypothetical protein